MIYLKNKATNQIVAYNPEMNEINEMVLIGPEIIGIPKKRYRDKKKEFATEKKYQCNDCENKFKSLTALIDVICPKCAGNDIYKQ